MIERWPAQPEQTNGGVAAPHATALHGEAPVDAGLGAGEHLAPVPGSELAEAVAEEIAAERKPKRKASKWAKRVAWLFAMVAMGCILGAVIIFFLKFIDGPAVTTESTTLAQLHASPSASPAMSMWAGKYVQLKYPGKFDQIGQAPGNPRALEAYNLSSKSSAAREITINVYPLASNNLEDDSSYKYRSITPALYTKKDIKLGGEPAAEMVKTDRGEATMFWAHKGMLLTISASTDDPGGDRVAEYIAQIEPTIVWRQ